MMHLEKLEFRGKEDKGGKTKTFSVMQISPIIHGEGVYHNPTLGKERVYHKRKETPRKCPAVTPVGLLEEGGHPPRTTKGWWR